MAILERLPSNAVIKKLAGVVDFYLWKGIPCARSWPCKPTNTPAIQKTHSNMRNGLAFYDHLSQNDLDAWKLASKNSDWTPRDMFLSHCLLNSCNRSLIEYQNFWYSEPYIHVEIERIQDPKPYCVASWFDTPDVSNLIQWKTSYKKVRGYSYPTKNKPLFTYGYWKTISWLNSHGFMIFRNRGTYLFLMFVDPTGKTFYSSGVYIIDATIL